MSAAALTAGAAAPAGLAGAADSIRADLGAAAAALPAYLRPAGVVVTTHRFTPAGGELTPNLKLRRATLQQRYAAALDALYARLDSGGDATAWPLAGEHDGEDVLALRL